MQLSDMLKREHELLSRTDLKSILDALTQFIIGVTLFGLYIHAEFLVSNL